MMRYVMFFVAIFLASFSFSLFAGYGGKLCKSNPDYACYKVKRGDSWKKLYPDESERELVMKINRMNTHLYAGLTIAIPHSENFSLLDASPFERQIDPPGEKVIFVSIQKLAWGAYAADGTLIQWGPISAAKGYCPDIHRGCHTSLGRFEVYRKLGSGCKSSKYPVGRGGAPMPYCMFFNGGFALHGSYNVPGYHDSHGCVRLFVNDAKWLNQDFVGDENVTVIVR